MKDILTRLRAAYQAWHESKGKSIETWLALVAEEIDFRSLADGAAGAPWSKRRRTREEVRHYLTGLTAEFEMIHFTVDRFVSEDDTVVMVGSTAWTCKRTGRKVYTPKVDVWRFKNGLAVEFSEYFDTARLADAARS
jgi:ketosteroid isomerase-like protein